MLMFFIGAICCFLLLLFVMWVFDIEQRVTALEKKVELIERCCGRAVYEVRMSKAA